MKLNEIIDALVNKFHIILGTISHAAVLIYHFKTGHDIGSGVTNALYAYYCFLAGHAFTYQKYPDQPTP